MVNAEKHHILKILIESKEQELTIRKLSLMRKINYKSAYNAVMKLKEIGIIEVQKLGNASRCSFNRHFNSLVFEVESQRKDALLHNKDFQVLYDRVCTINKQFILLLFGSHVKGTATKHSDIDLLLIAREADAKEIESEIALLPYKIHLTTVTYEDFMRMLKSNTFSVGSEAIKKNIILFGIEDYYRLMTNAR